MTYTDDDVQRLVTVTTRLRTNMDKEPNTAYATLVRDSVDNALAPFQSPDPEVQLMERMYKEVKSWLTIIDLKDIPPSFYQSSLIHHLMQSIKDEGWTPPKR